MHKHKCPNCGFVWAHTDACFNNEDAHKCLKCGEFSFWHYEEREQPSLAQHCASDGRVVEIQIPSYLK